MTRLTTLLVALALIPLASFASAKDDAVRDALDQARAASRENDKEKSKCQKRQAAAPRKGGPGGARGELPRPNAEAGGPAAG